MNDILLASTLFITYIKLPLHEKHIDDKEREGEISSEWAKALRFALYNELLLQEIVCKYPNVTFMFTN